MLELYTWKGKVFKYQQKLDESLEFHEKARDLDQADRYLCNKSVKAYLRSGKIVDGQDVMSLFSKEDSEGEKLNVHLVQCL